MTGGDLLTNQKIRIFSGALLLVGIFVLALGAGIFYMGTNTTDDIKVISAIETSADVLGKGNGQGQVAGESIDSLINVNTASAAELDKLSGVGPVTSGKIIANRPYSSLEQLVLKRAISRSLLIKISNQITVGE